MKDERIQVNSVVQIAPYHDARFGGCFLVVTEVKDWGVQGYVTVPGTAETKGDAYYRVEYEHLVYIGMAEWINKIVRRS